MRRIRVLFPNGRKIVVLFKGETVGDLSECIVRTRWYAENVGAGVERVRVMTEDGFEVCGEERAEEALEEREVYRVEAVRAEQGEGEADKKEEGVKKAQRTVLDSDGEGVVVDVVEERVDVAEENETGPTKKRRRRSRRRSGRKVFEDEEREYAENEEQTNVSAVFGVEDDAKGARTCEEFVEKAVFGVSQEECEMAQELKRVPKVGDVLCWREWKDLPTEFGAFELPLTPFVVGVVCEVVQEGDTSVDVRLEDGTVKKIVLQKVVSPKILRSVDHEPPAQPAEKPAVQRPVQQPRKFGGIANFLSNL